MSDNKRTPDVPENSEPALSELISSAKEKIQRSDAAAGRSEIKKNEDKNGAADKTIDENKDKEEKTKVMSAVNMPNSDKNDKNIKDTADKTDRSDVPDISFKSFASAKSFTAADKAEKTEKPSEPKKPQASEKSAVQKTNAPSAADKKTEPEKPAKKAEKPAAKTPEKHSAAAAKKQAQSKKTAENAAADKPKNGARKADKKDGKKAKFTKKQVFTVLGLIASLLLVLALIVVLIFNYYYSMLDTSGEKVNNSKPMTYSDVDLSRADTIDKAAEDEKLKELMETGEKISNKDVMNILLIGEDLRDTESGESGNTDVMMIISVNTKDKTITMTSIMRDCYVYIPGWYSTRINAAYHHGGVDLTKETIESYMNVKIDRYVLVNFNVFIEIVDTLGGLDLYVSDEEANGYPGADPYGDNTRGMQNPLDEQNKYLGNKKGTDYIEKGGNLHLNGNQALAYARLRHVGNSDYERTERQRKVIAEMIKKSRSMTIVEMDRLATKIFPQIKTDVTKAELAGLLVDMLDYRNYEIQELRVPSDGTFSDAVVSGMDVLMVDFDANAQIFRDTVYGSIELDEEGNETKNTIE